MIKNNPQKDIEMFEDQFYNGKRIINRECRFATYVKPPNYSDPDLHVVKEILHLSRM